MGDIKELTQINFGEWILIAFIIMSGTVTAINLIGKFSMMIGKPFKWVQSQNKDHETLLETTKRLQELRDKHESDVNKTIKHEDIIRDDLSKLSTVVSELKNEISLLRQERDQDKLAEYKDKIGENYRIYHARKLSDENPIPYWNHMEKEALEGLIKQYEAHGGQNSFVHSVVEKEKDTWIIVE